MDFLREGNTVTVVMTPEEDEILTLEHQAALEGLITGFFINLKDPPSEEQVRQLDAAYSLMYDSLPEEFVAKFAASAADLKEKYEL